MFGWRLRRIMDNLKHWSQKCLRHQFSPPTNPSFLLWFQESDIVTCLLRRKDGPLLSFIFRWIITLSFFIWPFITDLSVFLSVYTTVQVSHSLSTQGWTHWSHMQSFLSVPIGLSGEWSFSNLEQILNSLPEPYQQMHLISLQTGISCKKKCCLPPHFQPPTAADITLSASSVLEYQWQLSEALEVSSSGPSLCMWSKKPIKI